MENMDVPNILAAAFSVDVDYSEHANDDYALGYNHFPYALDDEILYKIRFNSIQFHFLHKNDLILSQSKSIMMNCFANSERILNEILNNPVRK